MISVLITTRNADTYIEECLRSVVNQEFKAFEVIIVDDGSTDRTLEIIDSVQKNNNELDFRIIKENKIGRANALNVGVHAARHDWIAILDGDDLWHPKKLKRQVDILIANDPDVLGTNRALFRHSKDIKHPLISSSKPIIKMIYFKQAVYNSPICHSTAIIKKSLCSYDESRVSLVDYELWLRLLYNGAVVMKIDEPLTYKRLHPEQSFEAKNRARYILNSFQLRLQYALKTGHIGVLFYIVCKAAYYVLIPTRFKRTWLIRHGKYIHHS